MSPRPPWHPERFAARLPFLRRRARLVADTRAFFAARGYTEVETPCLVPVPGMEVHLRAFRSEYRPHLGAGGARRTLWLRTSPELALKRLLVAGAGPVFELARVWRNGEAGTVHAPEFTMLEWYRPGLSFEGLMDETEAFAPRRLPARGGAWRRRDRPPPALRAPHRGGGLRSVLRRPRHPRHGGRRGAAARRSRAPRRCRRAPRRGGRTCSSGCSANGWSRGSAAGDARPSSPTGRRRRRPSRAATRPMGAPRCASSCSSPAWSSPTPSTS